jgi:radical SAM-linked protein
MITCLKFGKERSVAYISHLDVIRAFERTFRRAKLPLAFSQGFSPRPKMVFGQPLPLGLTSSGEYVDITLEKEMSEKEVLARLEETMPPGFVLYEAKNLDDSVKPIMSVITHASYLFLGDSTKEILKALEYENIPYVRERKGKKQVQDLRPLIETINICEGGVKVVAKAGSRANLRPDALICALGLDKGEIRVHRENLFLQKDGKLISPLMRS